jgi:hypothetical protein
MKEGAMKDVPARIVVEKGRWPLWDIKLINDDR